MNYAKRGDQYYKVKEEEITKSEELVSIDEELALLQKWKDDGIAGYEEGFETKSAELNAKRTELSNLS